MSLLDTASLLLTPNAYKEGKLYSVIPSDGSGDFTFTRATTATRVNSDGLVELVPYNLLRYSEMFSIVTWNKQNATISDNVTTAPDGTFTADKLVADATLAQHSIYQSGPSLDSGAYVVSCYAKAAEYSFFSMGNAGGVTGGPIIFNLTNGTFSGSFSGGIPTIESVGNGWYRCSIAFFSATPSFSWWIIARNANNTSNYTGNGTDGIFIWGAQLVQGTSARDYLRTETRLNIPRLDYSLGGCPSILLEPQRTNLALQSSSFDSATWGKVNATVTANTTTSPSGIVDADEITDSSGSFGNVGSNVVAFSSADYSVSLFIKKKTSTTAYLGIEVAGNGRYLTFNSVSGDIKYISADVFNNKKLISFNDDWWYLSFTVNVSASTAVGIRFFPSISTDGSSLNAAATGTETIYGAQLEAGSYATSYIPTTTASVTRNSDQVYKTGISSLINSTEGVLYAEIAALSNDLTNRLLSLSDGTSTNRIFLGFNSLSNSIRFRVQVNNVYQAEDNFIVADTTQYLKIGFKFKENDFALWINGVEVLVDNSGSTFSSNTLNTLSFDSGAGGSEFFGKCKNLMVFPTALSDDELATLTTI
jgi:hypothetical protein